MQQGALAFTVMASGDLVMSVLSATLIIDSSRAIYARNYSAPRFPSFGPIVRRVVRRRFGSARAMAHCRRTNDTGFPARRDADHRNFHRSMLPTLSARAQALHLAEHDALTGILIGKAWIMPQSDHTQRGCQMTLICIDLDGFKQVNHQYGRCAGDVLLVQVAERLSQELRGDDLFARRGAMSS